MELTNIIMEPLQYEKYEKARKRVKEMKNFQTHVRLYVVIVILIVIARFTLPQFLELDALGEGFMKWLNANVILTPLLWGIGLAVHGLIVYRKKVKFFKDWEERKIKEIMDKEEDERQRWN